VLLEFEALSTFHPWVALLETQPVGREDPVPKVSDKRVVCAWPELDAPKSKVKTKIPTLRERKRGNVLYINIKEWFWESKNMGGFLAERGSYIISSLSIEGTSRFKDKKRGNRVGGRELSAQP
jgi:hypothetical protein